MALIAQSEHMVLGLEETEMGEVSSTSHGRAKKVSEKATEKWAGRAR